ncbi:MAG: hypothetical protein QOK24_934 [Verrucomicrobiota bacterium]
MISYRDMVFADPVVNIEMNAKKMMISCPKTSKPVFTGIAIDEVSFKDPTNRFTNNSVSCPHCGGTHTWSKEDAFLQ